MRKQQATLEDDPDPPPRTRRRARRAVTVPKDPVRKWWLEPIPEWPGRLIMHNIARDETVVIELRDSWIDDDE